MVALCVLAAPVSGAAGEPPLDVTSAVVRVDVTRGRRETNAPWKMLAPEQSSGTAFAIGPGRLVTNAHVVRDALQVTVKKNDGSAPVLATVQATDDSCDLAVLGVENPSFPTNVRPLALGGLPAVGSSVTIYGYPIGGFELSTTTGVVSRMESQYYLEGSAAHLAGQTDAAINPGNSGGPVVQGNAVVGVAFQHLRARQNIGFFIPAPIVRHFLDDFADGKYGGFPDVPLVVQPIESPALRRERALPEGRSGVVVEALPRGSSLREVLAPGDVILAVDGQRVSDDGTFASGQGRLPLSHLFDIKSVGQPVPLQIWRNGEAADVVWRADRYAPWDRLRSRATARYLVYGGLVFVPLSYAYLAATNLSAEHRAWIQQAMAAQMWGPGSGAEREIVLLVGIIPDPVNEGVHANLPLVLESLNDEPVGGLAELARKLDSSQEARDVFALGHPYDFDIAIDHQAAAAGRAAFLRANGIPHDRNL